MPTFAFYRSLYGEDFFRESVASVIDHVDGVFMLLADVPWGRVDRCTYRDRTIFFPRVIDSLRAICEDMERRSSKFRVINAFNPLNKDMAQWALSEIRQVAQPTRLLFMEPDMVWEKGALERFFELYNAGSMKVLVAGQVELWRKFGWRVPYRAGRASSFLWDIEDASRSGDLETTEAVVHNLGFCVSDRAMFWKHMLGLGISKPLQDSMPNEDWFERTWLNWDPITNNRNLEIAKGSESNLTHAEQNQSVLPKLLTDGLHEGKWDWMERRIG